MPLIANKIKISDGILLTWKLEESEAQLESMLPPGIDRSEYSGIGHPLKRREWLAGRCLFAALCEQAGFPFQGIWKSPDGKPYLLGSTAHISLSHTEHLIAAALDLHAPIGIDLETPRPQLLRIAHKFLSPEELSAAGADQNLLCKYWTAKEAIYKLVGEKQISFREHIRVYPSKADLSWTGRVSAPAAKRQATTELHRVLDYYLAIARDVERPTAPLPWEK